MKAAALVLLSLVGFMLLLALCSSCTPAALLLQREALGYLRRAQTEEANSTGAALSAARACIAAARGAEAAAWLSYPDISPAAAAARQRMRATCQPQRHQAQDLGQAQDLAHDMGQRDQAQDLAQDLGGAHVG